ncbi:MAG: WYL domain-containing protein [Propionibacteriaceae bacterium]|jgi:proteasome accessory factor C|nr:WYL domain-containing protein [Propionibacteriaceae bacterium]
MSGSIDQVARLLLLIPFAQRHPGVSVAQTAARFHVTEQQIRLDLAVAFMCGLPGGLPGDLIDIDMDALDSDGLIFLTNADVLTEPLKVTATEAAGLTVALAAIREVAAPSVAALVDEVLAKIALTVPGVSGRTDVSLAAGDPAVRGSVAAAIAEAARIRVTYAGQARGVVTTPVVDPVRITAFGGAAYLIAYSLDRDDWRTYRLDRITAVEPTGQASSRHGPPPADDAWQSSLATSSTVTITVTADSLWITDYLPHRGFRPRADGGADVDLPVVDPAWLDRLLLSLGDTVVGLIPSAAATGAAERAQAALAAYRTAGLADDEPQR